MTDHELLQRFIETRDEAAFAELVRRHVDLVWGVGRRQVPAAADDITQAVFILLFQKAADVRRHGNVAGWLFRTAHYCCANLKRTEVRRMRHEQNAPSAAGTKDNTAPTELISLLDDALKKLPCAYRDAVLVRYLQEKSIAEAAMVLGLSEAAVAKRAARGLEKLRLLFATSGCTVAAPAVTALLVAEAAKGAPVHIAGHVTAAAFAPHCATAKAGLLAQAIGKTPAAVPFKAVAGTLIAAAVTGMIVSTATLMSHRSAAPAAAMFVSAPTAAAAPDETTIPGDLHIVRYDVLLDAAGAAALQKLSHALPAKADFLELRQARAADVRAALKSLAAQGRLPGPGWTSHGDLPPRVPGFSINGSLILPSLGSGNFFVDATMPGGARYNESLAEMLGYAEERASNVDIRFDFDDCKLALRSLDETAPFAEPFEKIAALHWNGILAPGDALLFYGDWGEFHGDHLVGVRVFETYRVTAAEAPYVDSVEFGPWIDTGPPGARAIADRTIAWAAKGESHWLDGKEKWTRRLSDGTIVRLLALSRPAQWPYCWWNPDGAPTARHFAAEYLVRGASRASLAAAVEVLRPDLSLKPDPHVWRDGIAVALPDQDRHLEIYVGTGSWSEQDIQPRTQVLVGDEGYVRLEISSSDGEKTFTDLRGHLPPDTEVRLAAVTKSGAHLSGNVSDDAGSLFTADTPLWKGDKFFFTAERSAIDHYVLLTRKREQVAFDNFADAPVVEPSSTPVSPDELQRATQAIARMDPEPDAWTDLWKTKQRELARLDTLPRDAAQPLGSMRLMIDEARAGDAPAVKTFLHSSDDHLAAEYAAALAAFGKTATLLDQRFGREPLLHEFSKRRNLLSLEATYLEPDCQFSNGIAYNSRDAVPLVQSGNRWLLDLDQITKTAPKEKILAACGLLTHAATTLNQKIGTGEIQTPAAAVDFLLKLELYSPPVPIDFSAR